MLIEYSILACAIGGFSVSAYIYQTVQRKKTLTCPIGHTCDSVVHSKYGETFGFKNTLLGMLYYGGIALIYVLEIIEEIQFIPHKQYLLLGITTGAFFFSLYLIYIQAFVLKEWCSWCVLSALLTTGIFLGHLILFI